MKILSPDFQHDGVIPKIFTCQGKDTSPALQFEDVPKEAKSLAFILDDPDAPGGTWTHWTVWNIPPTILEIAQSSVPQTAIQGITSAGTVGYHGPCPPVGSGTHRYFFHLYALGAKLDLPKDTSPEQLKVIVDKFMLAKAFFVGLYSKD